MGILRRKSEEQLGGNSPIFIFVSPLNGGLLKKELTPLEAISSLSEDTGSVVQTYFFEQIGKVNRKVKITVIILNIGTDRSEQTVQTQIRLLLMEQSDQGLLCLLFCLHLLNTILHCKIQLFQL